jgi:redox-sensitive bicupin YhaK (pirin superfamily)
VEAVVRRAGDRFVTHLPGVETRHGLSFGAHYDPDHVAHGPLVVCDEHRLKPGAGFAPHRHRDVEVVSWVLEGVLRHEGPGGKTEVAAGSGQWLSTGSGVVHAELAGEVPTRFVQTWLVSPGGTPSYESLTGAGPALQRVGARGGATLHVGRVDGSVALPAASYLHVQVSDGRLRVAGVELAAGDAVRLTGTGAELDGHAHVLVWEMHTTP